MCVCRYSPLPHILHKVPPYYNNSLSQPHLSAPHMHIDRLLMMANEIHWASHICMCVYLPPEVFYKATAFSGKYYVHATALYVDT